MDELTNNDKTALIKNVAPSQASNNGGNYGYGQYGGGEATQGIHLREVWRIIRKRRWLIFLIAFFATILLTIEVHRAPSIYRAEGVIEAAKDRATLIKSDDNSIAVDSNENINTLTIIFKSRPLLEDIVVLLNLDRNPKFTENLGKKSFVASLKDIGYRLIGKKPQQSPKSETTANITRVTNLHERSLEDSRRLAPYVKVLQDELTVETDDKSSEIMRVSMKHTNPALAASIIDTSIKNFISRSYERKTTRFRDTSGWLKRSTNELLSRVQQAEQALADYTKSRGIVTNTDKVSLTTDRLTTLHSQAQKAEYERVIKQTLYEDVTRGLVMQLPGDLTESKTALLQNEINKLEVEAAELDLKYGPENYNLKRVQSRIKVLRDQMTSAKRSVEDKVRADYERSLREERSLKTELDKSKAEAVQENQDDIQYSILKSNVETANTMYKDFLVKSREADLQLHEQSNNLRIVQTADVPGSSIGPHRIRTIFIGFLISLTAGICLALFIEYLDNTVKSIDDVSRVAFLPTLAVIPSIPNTTKQSMNGRSGKTARLAGIYQRQNGNKDTEGGAASGNGSNGVNGSEGGQTGSLTKLVPLDKLSSIVEAYRMLRTSVLLSAAGSPPRTILFTSGQPSEGKTTTAINTAISLAQLGSSVLLIDADLRRPSVHRVFKINHTQGLSTYLSRPAEIESLIVKTWISNLSVLPCGAIPPNPAELISSERMKDVLKQLAGKFDHIVIDSPPLINVTDPVILSTMVDGVILVVHAGHSTRDVVRRARHELTSVGAKIFGVVLNNLDIKREGYGSYLSTYDNYGYASNRDIDRQ